MHARHSLYVNKFIQWYEYVLWRFVHLAMIAVCPLVVTHARNKPDKLVSRMSANGSIMSTLDERCPPMLAA